MYRQWTQIGRSSLGWAKNEASGHKQPSASVFPKSHLYTEERRYDVKPRVVILGWYGNRNLGDEIILECILAQIRGLFPGARFVVISDDPEDTRKRHGVESIARSGGRVQRLRRLLTVTGADLFILGGGGLLKPFGLKELSVLTWLGPLELAQEVGVPTMTYAVGISDGFSPRAEEALKGVLGRTNAVLVRDEMSSEFLGRLGVSGVRVTADPSLTLSELHPRDRSAQINPRPTRVSVFINQWYVSMNVIQDQRRWEAFEKALAVCLDHLIETFSASVKFVPMQITNGQDDDRLVAREVFELMEHKGSAEVVEKEVSLAEALDLVSRSSLVVGMRLHSLVLATVVGIPAVAIDYHSKVRNFADAIGITDWVVEISGSAGESMEVLASKALSGGYPTDRVTARIKELQELSRENARVAATLIQGRRGRIRFPSRIAKGFLAILRRSVRRSSW